MDTNDTTDAANDVSKDTPMSRKERKEEGKRRKRSRIEEAGGVRPRSSKSIDSKKQQEFRGGDKDKDKDKSPGNKKHRKDTGGDVTHHRFGRVMDRVPCRNKPRFSTLSIALPGSVLSNCQTRELKTHLVGQIARACTLYHVDEIVVFDDKLSKHDTRHRQDSNERDNDVRKATSDRSCDFLARVLQYCECPQYLRRSFFPHHSDLQFAGLLPPIDAPHHVRAEDRSKYREGVVLASKNQGENSSLVNCGVKNRPVE